jgi:ABC-type nitrate/sulfonate/bicarbonate transport systems, periplasmic components
MQTGTVAGAIVTPPNDLKAEALGFRLLVFSGDFMDDSLLGVLGTSERRIKERPDQVKKMVRAIVKSLLFIRQQPEQVTTFAAALLEIGPQTGRQKLPVDREDHEPRWQRH